MIIKNKHTLVVTATAHKECDRCNACIGMAKIHAHVTGSSTATYRNDERGIGGREHSATVGRE
tara:strand:- start:45 stop:233 length:189 start_codon:yes stop_codon:yes gene_type:complete